MGFFRRKEKRELEQQTAVVPEIDDVLLRALLAGEEIDEDKALSIPALAGAVAFIADTVAALPIKLYRDSPQEQSAEELTDDPRLSLLNDDGHDLMNAYEVKRAVVRDMLLHGAGYMHIQRSMNTVLGLRYVDRRAVAVIMNADPIFKEAQFNVGGKNYYPWDFVILTRNSRNGVTGVGLLRQINSLLATVRSEMMYEGNIAKTGGNKKGFLQSERKLSSDAINELKRAWRELYSTNGDNMMILNDGIKYQQAASTSVEMQLNEHKQTNSSWIDMCCGLNTDVISGRASTDGYMSAVRTSVLPVVDVFQAALNKSLLLETEKKALYFVLDTTELLKSDMVSRFNAYSVGLQNNFLRIDEVRYKENLPPIGFNYIKLGLQDVLLDPETGDIYTPNTNQMVNVGSVKGLTAGGNGGIIEERKKDNWTKGAKGYFTGSVSNGAGGRARMTKAEYNRLCSEILTNRPRLKIGSYGYHYFGNYFYAFTVIEPGTYKFNLKINSEKKKALVQKWRAIIDED